MKEIIERLNAQKDTLAECFANRGLLSVVSELDKSSKADLTAHLKNCGACRQWAVKHNMISEMSRLNGETTRQ